MATRILITVPLVIALFMLLLAQYCRQGFENLQSARASSDLHHRVVLAASSLEAELDEAQRDLLGWAGHPDLRKTKRGSEDPALLVRQLRNLLGDRSLFRGLGLLASDQSILAATSGFQTSEAVQFRFGAKPPPLQIHDADVFLVHPVLPSEGTPTLWLAGQLSRQVLEERLEGFSWKGSGEQGPGPRLVVVDEADAPLWTSGAAARKASFTGAIGGLLAEARSGEVQLDPELEGSAEPTLVAAAPLRLGEARGVLVGLWGHDAAFQGSSDLYMRLLLSAGGSWLAFLVLGYLIASRLGRPLRRYVSLVATEADRIAVASQEQSVSTTQQANSIRETTATVRELKVSMDQTQEVASKVVSTAEASIRATAEGIEASTGARDAMTKLTSRVNDVTTTISALSREMGRISEILSVVNDLAEQSKFLALNAAIEAARAGEHGKGFGVVSVEVRNLAQQSQEATNQIRMIIEQTAQAMEVALHTAKEGQEEAHRGQLVVDRTKQVIDSLSEVIKDAKLSSDQILASINQQSLGIDQIASAIDQIDEGVNQTVNAAEHTASISISLRDASEKLGTVVGESLGKAR